jgi:hypothetical protein
MECLDSVKNESFSSFLKQGLFFRKNLEKNSHFLQNLDKNFTMNKKYFLFFKFSVKWNISLSRAQLTLDCDPLVVDSLIADCVYSQHFVSSVI